MKPLVVTGYVPLPQHPRPPEEYAQLGRELRQGLSGWKTFYDTWSLENCWLHAVLADMASYNVSEDNNPRKNTAAYHIVQHQKTEWMCYALEKDHAFCDTVVWIDYGILNVPGVSLSLVNHFLRRLEQQSPLNHIAIPGCAGWGTIPQNHVQLWWRFCGGVLVCPRSLLYSFDRAIKLDVMNHLHHTRNLSWEVNTWARIERVGGIPIRWYEADHNERLFTGY